LRKKAVINKELSLDLIIEGGCGELEGDISVEVLIDARGYSKVPGSFQRVAADCNYEEQGK